MSIRPSLTLRINGTSRATQARTVAELVDELSSVPQALLIEHNRVALHRSQWEETRLAEEDQIEILRISAGG